MIDNEIEKALATDKVDWKEPLWAKFRNYVIGFGVAVVFVALVLTAAYFWLKPEPLAPQTEPVTMTIEPIPQVTAKAPTQKRAKAATEKIAAQASNAAPVSDMGIPISQKPRIDDGFTAEFDKQVLNLESKL